MTEWRRWRRNRAVNYTSPLYSSSVLGRPGWMTQRSGLVHCIWIAACPSICIFLIKSGTAFTCISGVLSPRESMNSSRRILDVTHMSLSSWLICNDIERLHMWMKVHWDRTITKSLWRASVVVSHCCRWYWIEFSVIVIYSVIDTLSPLLYYTIKSNVHRYKR